MKSAALRPSRVPAYRLEWRFWMTPLLVYAFSIETVQQLRGIDPRFSQAEPVSQLFGSLFFIAAMGIINGAPRVRLDVVLASAPHGEEEIDHQAP